MCRLPASLIVLLSIVHAATLFYFHSHTTSLWTPCYFRALYPVILILILRSSRRPLFNPLSDDRGSQGYAESAFHLLGSLTGPYELRLFLSAFPTSLAFSTLFPLPSQLPTRLSSFLDQTAFTTLFVKVLLKACTYPCFSL